MGDAVECGSIRSAQVSLILCASMALVVAQRADAAPKAVPPGEKMVQALRANTVAIRAEWEEDGNRSDGFGFIIAIERGYTYVATANHVVRGYEGDSLADKVSVRFFGSRKSLPAEVLKQHDATLDVGVIRIKGQPKRPWFRSCSGEWSSADRGTSVWFIGRSGTWYTPARPGTVNYLDPDLGLVLEGLSVIVGTSGAPLVSEAGIVGLMTTDAAGDLSRACPIKQVRKVIKGWKVPWQLVPPDLEKVPPGVKISPDAVADAARLAARMENFEAAAIAARRAFKENPKNLAAAELLVTAATRGPWRLCLMQEQNSCRSDNPYLTQGMKALAAIKKADPERAGSETVLAAEARLLRMRGKYKAALKVASRGLKTYSESPMLLAEVGAGRARAGDKEGVPMVARAAREMPNDALLRLYLVQAHLDVSDPIGAARALPPPTEMGAYYTIDPKLYRKLAPLFTSRYAKLVWEGLVKLLPQIIEDTAGTAVPYDALRTLMKKHATTAGYSPNVELLRAFVALREGRTDEAIKSGETFLQRNSGLDFLLYQAAEKAPETRQPARRKLQAYYSLLKQADRDAKGRYVIERYGDLNLPFSVPHEAWPAKMAPVIKLGYDSEITKTVTDAAVTMAVGVVKEGVYRFRLPDFEIDDFVTVDSEVCAVAASGDGKVVAFVTQVGKGYVWSPKALLRLKGPKSIGCSVAVSPDGRRVAAATAKKRFVTWSTQTGKPSKGPKLPWLPSTMAFTANGKKVLMGTDQGAAFSLVGLRDKRAAAFSCGDVKKSSGVAVDGASLRVVSAAYSQLHVCEAPSGALVASLDADGSDAYELHLADQGRRLVFRFGGRRAAMYDLESPAKRRRKSSAGINGKRLAFSADFDRAVATNNRGELELYERGRSSLRRVGSQERQRGQWARVAIDPSRELLGVMWRADGRTQAGLLGINAKEPACTIKRADQGRVPTFAAGGRLFSLTDRDHETRYLYDRTCKRLGRSSHFDAVSPSGQWSVKPDGARLLLTDVAAGTTVKSYDCSVNRQMTAAAFSPDNRWLFAASPKLACVISVDSGNTEHSKYAREIGYLSRKLASARSVDFTADGRLAVVVDSTGAIDLWEVPDGARTTVMGPLYRSSRHPDGLPRVVVEPGGRSFLTLSGDGDLMRWSLETKTLMATASAASGKVRDLTVADNGKLVFVIADIDSRNNEVRVFRRADLTPLMAIRAFPRGGWIAYGPGGRCFQGKHGDAVIPAYAVENGKVTKTGRTCNDTALVRQLR